MRAARVGGGQQVEVGVQVGGRDLPDPRRRRPPALPTLLPGSWALAGHQRPRRRGRASAGSMPGTPASRLPGLCTCIPAQAWGSPVLGPFSRCPLGAAEMPALGLRGAGILASCRVQAGVQAVFETCFLSRLPLGAAECLSASRQTGKLAATSPVSVWEGGEEPPPSHLLASSLWEPVTWHPPLRPEKPSPGPSLFGSCPPGITQAFQADVQQKSTPHLPPTWGLDLSPTRKQYCPHTQLLDSFLPRSTPPGPWSASVSGPGEPALPLLSPNCGIPAVGAS